MPYIYTQQGASFTTLRGGTFTFQLVHRLVFTLASVDMIEMRDARWKGIQNINGLFSFINNTGFGSWISDHIHVKCGM